MPLQLFSTMVDSGLLYDAEVWGVQLAAKAARGHGSTGVVGAAAGDAAIRGIREGATRLQHVVFGVHGGTFDAASLATPEECVTRVRKRRRRRRRRGKTSKSLAPMPA